MAIRTVQVLRTDPDAFALVEIKCDLHGAGFADGQLVKAVRHVVSIAEIETARVDGENDGLPDLVAITSDAQFVSAGGLGAEIWNHGAGKAAVVEDDDGAIFAFEPVLAEVVLVAVTFKRGALPDHLRARFLKQCGIECQFRGLHVALHLDARNGKRLTDVVEALGASVLGQRVDDIHVHAEQIIDRVLIFTPVQPTQHGSFLRVVFGAQIGAESGHEILHGILRGLFLLWRRHFPRGDAIKHAHPFFQRRSISARGGE